MLPHPEEPAVTSDDTHTDTDPWTARAAVEVWVDLDGYDWERQENLTQRLIDVVYEAFKDDEPMVEVRRLNPYTWEGWS